MQTRLYLVVAILLLAATPFAAQPRRDALVFITSKNQTTTSLSTAELRNIYLGRTTRWKNGRRILVIVRPPAMPAGREFLDRVVRMSEIDFSQDWLGAVFRGEAAAAPRVIGSTDAVRKAIAENTDAIAFVLSSELVAEDETSIRVLAVDGKTRDEPSYPFVIR
ncbi:MAG TPA: hypothetical protein VHU41_00975 [Thermoanaerobaculia bacterium]|nr:hypothetical protein [Thermoanaerobaculia bacterium]